MRCVAAPVIMWLVGYSLLFLFFFSYLTSSSLPCIPQQNNLQACKYKISTHLRYRSYWSFGCMSFDPALQASWLWFPLVGKLLVFPEWRKNAQMDRSRQWVYPFLDNVPPQWIRHQLGPTNPQQFRASPLAVKDKRVETYKELSLTVPPLSPH